MPDGVWFVALAPVGDALDVPQAVLSVIGPPDPIWVPDADPVRAVLPPLDRLADMLATRQLVLVLDNCEHLIGAVARLAGRVLPEAPGVRILATSREPLGVTGETLCPVPSLPLPPDGATPAEALEYGSVRLLAERGAAVRPGFTIDEVSVEPVIRICRALDGNPLAIELAAARLRSLTPGAGGQPSRRPVQPAHRGQPDGAAAPPDAAGHRGLELGPAGRARTHGPAAPVGVQRRAPPPRRPSGCAGPRAPRLASST